MAARETAAQKRSRVSALLADYDNRSRELNKLKKIVDGLKEQIKELPSGTYGEWQLAFSSGRELFDQAEAKRLLTNLGVEIPMFTSAQSAVVAPVAAGAKK